MRSLVKSRLPLTTVVLVGAAESLSAQPQGIPIDHKLTIEKCGGCHRRDKDGIMSRISFVRTTPEIREQNIKWFYDQPEVSQ